MSNVEEDIKRCKKLTEPQNANWIGISNQLAIAGALARIQELEEENRIFALEGSRVALKLHIEENYIPKQKVKEIIYTIIDYKIPRATNNGYYYDYFIKQEYKNDFVKLFNKLLEDK